MYSFVVFIADFMTLKGGGRKKLKYVSMYRRGDFNCDCFTNENLESQEAHTHLSLSYTHTYHTHTHSCLVPWFCKILVRLTWGYQGFGAPL